MLNHAFNIRWLQVYFDASQVREVLLQHRDCRAKFVGLDARS
jgi:hypothetical protein